VVVILERAGLDPVLVRKGKPKTEVLTHLGIVNVEAVRNPSDLRNLVRAKIIHIFTRPDFDFLTVVESIFAHGLASR
jgi:hypothetical protein